MSETAGVWLDMTIDKTRENADCPRCGEYVGHSAVVSKRYGNGWKGQSYHPWCAEVEKASTAPCPFFAQFGEHATMFGADQPASCCNHDWPEGYDPSQAIKESK